MCNFNEKLDSFAGIFWLVLAQLQNRFSVEHLQVAAYVRCLKEKEWKKWNIVCFYCTQSDILLCGIARFSRGNKSKLRTFQSQKWKKIKNRQPQTKFTGSYKKRVYLENIPIKTISHGLTLKLVLSRITWLSFWPEADLGLLQHLRWCTLW